MQDNSPWGLACKGCRCVRQVVIMGREFNQAQDHDLSPLISSGHIVVQPPSKPWRDFLKYIEASRRALGGLEPPAHVLCSCCREQ